MELLRIVSILLILIFHCAYKSEFNFTSGFSGNKLIVKTFWMFGELGVNLFVLISGYFMINGCFKWRKLIRMLAQVQFYWWGSIFFVVCAGLSEFPGLKDLFLSFFPVTLNRYWFITAYVILYIFSPYLNIFARSMQKNIFGHFLLTLLILYSIIPTMFGLFFNSTESMLYYNRLIWMSIMYFSGAYIRMYMQNGIFGNRTGKFSLGITAAVFAALVGSILIIDRLSNFFSLLGTTEPAYFWPPNTVLMVCLSFSVFDIFLHLRISYNPIINTIASTTLGIYLLHDGILFHWLWNKVFRCAEYQNSPFLIFYILRSVLIIFVGGVLIDLVRQILEKFISKLFRMV